MVLRLRMLSGEDENFIREFEVPGDMELPELHNFICENLEYDNSAPASFVKSDEEWNSLEEFTLYDMDAEAGEKDISTRPMEGVELSILVKEPRDRIIYVFDIFGNRGLYIELFGVANEPVHQEGLPRIVRAVSPAPVQFYRDFADPDSSIFEEALEDFVDFEGDDFYDED